MTPNSSELYAPAPPQGQKTREAPVKFTGQGHVRPGRLRLDHTATEHSPPHTCHHSTKGLFAAAPVHSTAGPGSKKE